jgi:hypothetical protein
VIGIQISTGSDSVLKDWVVQEGYIVPEQTEGKNETLMPLFEDIPGREAIGLSYR